MGGVTSPWGQTLHDVYSEYRIYIHKVRISSPLGRFSELDCSTTKRVQPIPNDVFGKLSATCFQRRFFWNRHCSNGGDIDHTKSAQAGVIYTVVRGRALSRGVYLSIFKRYSSCRYYERQLIDVTVVRRVRPRAERWCDCEGHRRWKRAGRTLLQSIWSCICC